ncbi:MAG: heparinase II/III family protein [Pseudomonadota bacterium]
MTTPADAAPAAEEDFEGKRLVRTGGGDKGLSLGERLAERLHRLTWRTPLHAMHLRGRHPLKLIAVPDDPLLGDVARGEALMAGRFVFRGEGVAIDDLGAAPLPRALADHIHSFIWLRDLSTVARRVEAAPVAERAMRGWLTLHADKVSQPAWRGDLVGRRIMSWAAHAPLILSSADLVYRSKVLNTLARQARHLERGADKVAPGAPRVAAWAGALTAALLIPGGDVKRAALEAGLARALAGAVFADGGAVARAPLAQLDLIALLTLLSQVYAVRRLEVAEPIRTTLYRMVPALLGVCHGDRGLASWQGGGPVAGETIAELVTASGVRARPMRQTRDWGYQRLSAATTTVIVDAAPPPIARLIEGGCASTLAFELSDGPQRIVVNCGGARTADAGLPPALAEGLRTTAAHSTLILADSNSTAIHADGTLGRGVVEVELSRQETDSASRIEAAHDGYVRRYGFLHRRQLALATDGRELRGEDMLLPSGKRRRADAIPFAIRFHLAPGIRVSPTADGLAALLRLPAGPVWQFRCRGAALAVEDSVWIDAAGRPQGSQQLVLTAEAPAGGASVGWALRRAN